MKPSTAVTLNGTAARVSTMAVVGAVSAFIGLTIGVPAGTSLMAVVLGFMVIAIMVALPIVITIEVLKKKKSASRKSVDDDYVFLGKPVWRDRYKVEVDKAVSNTPITESRATADEKAVGSSIHKTYPLFKTKSNIKGYYWRIEDICNTIQYSYVSKIEKQRAMQLKKLADDVVEYLQDLDDIGQLNEYTVQVIDGVKQYDDCSHADKGEGKLKLIFKRLNDMMDTQILKVSNEISDIKVDAVDSNRLYKRQY